MEPYVLLGLVLVVLKESYNLDRYLVQKWFSVIYSLQCFSKGECSVL